MRFGEGTAANRGVRTLGSRICFGEGNRGSAKKNPSGGGGATSLRSVP